MHTQAAGSAQHQRSTKRTKLLVRFAAWSTRILTLFSFVVFVLALKNIFHPFFGYLMFVTIICYGCCFMDMVDRNHSQQNVEAAVVMNQQISTSGGQANDSQFTNVPMDAQHTASSGGIRYSQCQSYLAGHDYMAAPHQQCIGVTADSEGPSFQPTMTMTSGQFVSPPPYTLYDPNVIS
ncbi:hypothetical protein MAR_034304 [Mya arenaria]|uniref:Uncharacterized protein n=1 Tax=Mya arenaria TaxID=6604 RepID=A0ABY7GBH3_MYAAR|nr:hypothetical protein MAR_034304 [Mya arenaria]